jgi:hypothetical protein
MAGESIPLLKIRWFDWNMESSNSWPEQWSNDASAKWRQNMSGQTPSGYVITGTIANDGAFQMFYSYGVPLGQGCVRTGTSELEGNTNSDKSQIAGSGVDRFTIVCGSAAGQNAIPFSFSATRVSN